jgi:hypothetical protein
MTAFLDKLNLRPGERRLVVFGALAVFIVLNIWLVWPQFGKVSFWQNRRQASEQKLNQFNKEISRKAEYEKVLGNLTRLGGQVPTEEQAIQMQKDVLSYAALTGVAVESSSTPQRGASGGRTNAFFEEQTMQLSVNTGERELVDFLYQLGTRNSLIRVRTMSLQPDPTRMRLKAQLNLVASYQKKQPARTVSGTAGPSKPATKPTPPAARTNIAPAKTNAPAMKPTTRGPSTTARPVPPSTIAASSKTNSAKQK